MDLGGVVKDVVKKIVFLGSIYIPDDVAASLKAALDRETDPNAKFMLSAIVKNIDLASLRKVAVCQDTGMPTFHVALGDGFPIRSGLLDIIRDAMREATKEIPLRPNTVDPFHEKNPGDNTGRYVPWIDVELIPGDYVEIAYLPKGGGSEAPNKAFTLPPGVAWRELRKRLLETVVEYGPMPCPPTIVGIGIAGTIDAAVKLAKKAALLRNVGHRHEDPKVAQLELELLRDLNRLGVGPHGVGGVTTALDVHIEYAHRHPAAFSVAFVFSCWATRRGIARIYPDGRYDILSHPETYKKVFMEVPAT